MLASTALHNTIVLVQWYMYVQCGRHIYSGAYANNMKCIYSKTCQIVDYSKFIL